MCDKLKIGWEYAAQSQPAMPHRVAVQPRRHLDVEAMRRGGRSILLRNRHAILSRKSRPGPYAGANLLGAVSKMCVIATA
jgi:hypothetical protein